MFPLNSIVRVSRSQPGFFARLTLRCNSTSVAAVHGTSGSVELDLYMNPSKWKNVPPQKIIDLYWERKTKLGTTYERCEEELDALISTSDYTGVSKDDIKKLYNGDIDEFQNIIGRDALKYGLRPFQFDELPSPAMDMVHDQREQRFYNRLAAYELPLLVQYRQPYKPINEQTHPVVYRYTTYAGEEHPNSKKVSITLKTRNLGLNDRELHKFRLLARTRYDHETDTFKMSSENFPEAAQNAKYLNDILQRLLKEAKDMTDDFSDVPLDTRHTVAKNLRKKSHKYEFPEKWKRPEDAPPRERNLMEKVINSNS
ncbi:hypothetical protein KAFR_0B06040 [Kazachstania africana CBS 2517]|uniref:Small ribosomal subunit protein mS35 n=1 Tax=Kazachstania africana (strain ATCC 22294 / BCRC 22015 / CBS 2517 / CECT 1963 / NBRC 1671 / NRRL Y-8276) TaxID=1071382 RepID=H2ARA0_KAZAF|nr:hypothetical protein KAFR_0B06040 [Kazachstania africana CBS 2517]CCF56900.1 hypothetical protein KAFR_0B06040 [Kazachstania africana CBS 2517]